MSAKSVECPGCGKSARGKFCGNCGTTLLASCPSCGITIKPGSRHECDEVSTPGATASWSVQTVAPWIAIAISSIALVVSLMTWFERNKSAETATSTPSPVTSPLSSSVPVPGQPVDLSTMTPREAADRLFNRVMAAVESGNTAEVTQFTPMALQAYANLPTLDNDGRYHVALIHMAANDIPGAREQVDMLRKTNPDHLFGFMLEYQIAERSGNKGGAAQAYKAFMDAFNREIAAGREEYQEHMKSIESFQKAAQASIAGKK